MSTFWQGSWPHYPTRESDGPAFTPILTPMPPRPWPFPVQPTPTPAPTADLLDDEPEDDSPYCLCDNLPTMGEVDRNRCAACGKPLK